MVLLFDFPAKKTLLQIPQTELQKKKKKKRKDRKLQKGAQRRVYRCKLLVATSYRYFYR